MLEAGTPAPGFEVTDHMGNRVRLDDYRGRSVVLWFYPRANTPGCTAEGCGFRDLSAEYAAKDAAILGVSTDDEAKNRAFAEKHGFDFPLLCDVERALGVAYGACDDAEAKSARRVGVVIDREGKVKAYFPKVDARSFPTDALAYL